MHNHLQKLETFITRHRYIRFRSELSRSLLLGSALPPFADRESSPTRRRSGKLSRPSPLGRALPPVAALESSPALCRSDGLSRPLPHGAGAGGRGGTCRGQGAGGHEPRAKDGCPGSDGRGRRQCGRVFKTDGKYSKFNKCMITARAGFEIEAWLGGMRVATE